MFTVSTRNRVTTEIRNFSGASGNSHSEARQLADLANRTSSAAVYTAPPPAPSRCLGTQRACPTPRRSSDCACSAATWSSTSHSWRTWVADPACCSIIQTRHVMWIITFLHSFNIENTTNSCRKMSPIAKHKARIVTNIIRQLDNSKLDYSYTLTVQQLSNVLHCVLVLNTMVKQKAHILQGWVEKCVSPVKVNSVCTVK